MSQSAQTLLPGMLELAVPQWVERLRDRPWEHIQARAAECSRYIAEHGDKILYRVPGQSAEAFNRLAEGIACLSFAPGGVSIFGRHWLSEHVKSQVIRPIKPETKT